MNKDAIDIYAEDFMLTCVSISLWKYWWVEWMCHTPCRCFTFYKTEEIFHWFYHFKFPLAVHEFSLFFFNLRYSWLTMFLQFLLYSKVAQSHTSLCCTVGPHCPSILNIAVCNQTLLTNDGEHIFLCLVVIHIFSFVKCSYIICQFLLDCNLITELKKFLFIVQVLCQIYALQIFLLFVDLLFLWK